MHCLAGKRIGKKWYSFNKHEIIHEYRFTSPLGMSDYLVGIRRKQDFRLVSGTALSLQLGHRMSVDIDLFTDAPYRSVDFSAIEKRLAVAFPNSRMPDADNHTIGKSYYLQTHSAEIIKLDLFYTDTFQYDCLPIKQLRVAHPLEIAAMKLELISRGGRKKDFWDMHALLERYCLPALVAAYEKRQPFGRAWKKF